jgi:hypothetical protein
MPLLRALCHYCARCAITARAAPLLRALCHYCARYAITARAAPLLRVLRHYCARCAIAARAMPLLRALCHYCARYAITDYCARCAIASRRRMILVGSGGIWWDLVGSGGIWWSNQTIPPDPGSWWNLWWNHLIPRNSPNFHVWQFINEIYKFSYPVSCSSYPFARIHLIVSVE